MKKAILLCGMLLAASATIASAAQGVNIRWNACFGDGGAFNRNFACNTNAGAAAMVGSFELGADLQTVTGIEPVVDISTASPSLPAWWDFFNPSSCRQAALSLNFANSLGAINCVDWGQGQVGGGLAAYIKGLGGPNTARVVFAGAVPSAAPQNLFSAQEYFAFNLIIFNSNTVACTGCTVPACIVFNSINLTTPVEANNRKLTGPTNLTDSNFCLYQGGGNPSSGRGEGCPGSTPTKSTTWGSVKSLYRN